MCLYCICRIGCTGPNNSNSNNNNRGGSGNADAVTDVKEQAAGCGGFGKVSLLFFICHSELHCKFSITETVD